MRKKDRRPNPPTIQSCAEIVSTSIDLKWQPPALPNGDIQYYLIDTSGPFPPSQINTSTSVLTYKVEPLLAANQYCFIVKTVNDGPDSIKTSGNSNQLCCRTKAASSSEPTGVTTNVLSSRNISVSWNYPDNPQGDIFGYRLRLRVNNKCQVEIIFFCTDCPNTQTIPYKDCGGDKQRQTVNLNKNQTSTTISYVVRQLLPYTNYDVWIAAHTTANDGLRHESVVQTISEVPQTPLSVTVSVVSSSEITVTWNQPAPRPGVTTYHVKAYEVAGNAQPVLVKIVNMTGRYFEF
ncbi:usherin-like [Mytilus californianus]|uniref:usherin-like n=1 Tax=Mytilus californianus TaxID=6549 RepID=UPI002244FCB7|nr:usherin-like [Mytilus californianus]